MEKEEEALLIAQEEYQDIVKNSEKREKEINDIKKQIEVMYEHAAKNNVENGNFCYATILLPHSVYFFSSFFFVNDAC